MQNRCRSYRANQCNGAGRPELGEEPAGRPSLCCSLETSVRSRFAVAGERSRCLRRHTVWVNLACVLLPIVTREQSRELDRKLIEEDGVPSLILMENAGRGAVEVLVREFGDAGKLVVVCGVGNNGGDGFVVARRWLTMGRECMVCLTGPVERMSEDARLQYRAYVGIGGRVVTSDADAFGQVLTECDLVVDAIFGTGLSRPIQGVEADVIERINASGKRVFALDLPSGLDANTGTVLGTCVRASVTVTFGCAKQGCFTFGATPYVGHVEVVDVGAPLPVASLDGHLAFPIVGSDVEAVLASEPPVGHKGQAGHVLVVAGTPGTLGAARLSAHGAFRGGAGVVTIATQSDAAAALNDGAWEVMVRSVGPAYSDGLASWVKKAASIVFGPGLGVSEVTGDWLEALVGEFRGVVVVDADGLTVLAQRPNIAGRTVAQLVLTPHPGEAGRLLGCSAAEVEADRFGAVRALGEKWGATVVLKGAPSLVAGERGTFVAPRGHACLSTAGSGDVLAGVIAALGARLPELDAARVGVWLHATAGERLGAGGFAARGLLARELADEVSRVRNDALSSFPKTGCQSSRRN